MEHTYRTDPRQIDLVEWLERNRETLDEKQRQQASCLGPDAGVSDMPAVGAGASPDVCRALRDGEEERR